MRPQTYGSARRGGGSVPRHRLRLAVLACGTAGGLVTLFHYDGRLSTVSAQPAGATGDPAPASAAAASPAAPTTPGRAAAAPGRTRTATRTAAGRAATTTVLGNPAQTRWGVVQVRLEVRDGKIVSAAAVQSPHSTDHSLEINARAVPILNRETVEARDGKIDAVSGATVTSGGYQESLQSALDKAHLG